ncbi:TetR/AcrR family transcriptional regulator [Streptomyces aurantiacus]|uniref:TetR family transcriptional regulator n=1 Tax=Streptomyces aurantiacus TaxID=47760 RepID=A0A7G1P958_9ACTN|nr:TetR/AcrR family transcriptional regulator [Streptomyces aurantiacus]MDQ0777700.1 AcrR family transcriptional regulator [Streptomyces aurantiacus]BCL31101.1 TetR family transcriptional regulator [Streptomyces aurantiacus]
MGGVEQGPGGAGRGGGAARGRPRSEAVERSIIEGVMRLLEEGIPLAEISIERVARIAGVGKATIYRRWSGREELFCDVMRTAEPPDPELPGTSMRDDLIVVLESHRRRGLANRSSTIMHNVYAQMKTSPKLWKVYHAAVIEPRRLKTLDVLRRGQENGEIRADVDVELANDLFVAPMLVRAIVRPEADLEEGLPERIVDTVLAGLGPTTPERRRDPE